MTRLRNLILFLALFTVANATAFAYPNFLQDYKSDKFTNPKNKDMVCNFCHMSSSGGDERNPFGQAFEAGGEKFTPLLRAQFPERFAYPMTKVDDNLTIHFSDPDNKVTVVQAGTKFAVVDSAARTVDGKAAAAPAGVVAAVPAPAATAPAANGKTSLTATKTTSAIPTDPYAREGAFFGQNVVDLPNGKPQKKGGIDFWIGHRFPEKTFTKGSPGDLFGFDSAAIVTFAVRAGITDRLSVSFSRANYFRTIEASAAYQVSRQADGKPVTLQLRGSIEGRNNFVRRHDLLP